MGQNANSNEGSARPYGEEMLFRCCECGLRLYPYIRDDGHYVSLREQAERSQAEFGLGIVLCRSCKEKFHER